MADAKVDVTKEEQDEERGFLQASGLMPEAEKSPLETQEDVQVETADPVDLGGETKGEEGASAPTGDDAAAIAAEEKFFLGEMTAEQVLEKLQSLEGMSDRVSEQVASRVFGKFGEVNQRLTELQGRELEFDQDALAKVKEVDESLYDALMEGLPKAFKGRQVDMEALKKAARDEVLGDLVPLVEQRLLDSLVENPQEIVKTKEFADWFFKVAPQSVRDTFDNWDKKQNLDGLAMARAFKSFDAFQEAERKTKEAKSSALKMSTEDKKATPTTVARRTLTEEDAFAARAKELTPTIQR